MANFFGGLFGADASGYEESSLLAVDVSRKGLRAAARQGLKVRQVYLLNDLDMAVTVFIVPEGRDPADILTALERRNIHGFMLNHYYSLDNGKSLAAADYSVAMIQWPASGKNMGRGLVIGMVDGPVRVRDKALATGRIVSRSFNQGEKGVAAVHGTAVAALLVGKTTAFTGLLPGAGLYAAAAFGGNGSDGSRATVMNVVRSLNWLAGKRVSVINASFSGSDNPLLRLAVKKIAQRGIPVVAAAGNHGPEAGPVYPAACDRAVAVTAVDRFMRPFARANRGGYIDFSAPGVRVAVPCGEDEICYHTGTSYAAPFVTAMIAKLKGRQWRRGSMGRIMRIIQQDALDLGVPGRDPVYGWGLLRCGKLCRRRLQ